MPDPGRIRDSAWEFGLVLPGLAGRSQFYRPVACDSCQAVHCEYRRRVRHRSHHRRTLPVHRRGPWLRSRPAGGLRPRVPGSRCSLRDLFYARGPAFKVVPCPQELPMTPPLSGRQHGRKEGMSSPSGFFHVPKHLVMENMGRAGGKDKRRAWRRSGVPFLRARATDMTPAAGRLNHSGALRPPHSSLRRWSRRGDTSCRRTRSK